MLGRKPGLGCLPWDTCQDLPRVCSEPTPPDLVKAKCHHPESQAGSRVLGEQRERTGTQKGEQDGGFEGLSMHNGGMGGEPLLDQGLTVKCIWLRSTTCNSFFPCTLKMSSSSLTHSSFHVPIIPFEQLSRLLFLTELRQPSNVYAI